MTRRSEFGETISLLGRSAAAVQTLELARLMDRACYPRQTEKKL